MTVVSPARTAKSAVAITFWFIGKPRWSGLDARENGRRI